MSERELAELYARPIAAGHEFFAAHYGPCSGCPAGIIPGDTIRPDGRGGYLHEDCELPDA